MFGDKLHLRNYSAEVHLDSPKDLYFTGELISGTFVVTARSPLTVSDIVVTLRCDEDAYVYVDYGSGGSYVHDHETHVSEDQNVFPEHPTPYESSEEPPNFTLKEGTHTFNFSFELPMGPQTIPNDGNKSSLSWYVKGVVHRGSMLSMAVRGEKEITVCPSVQTPLDLSQFLRKTEKTTLNAYLPGYNDRVKGASGRLKEMFTTKSDLRQEVELDCYVKVPVDGVPQSPATLPIKVGITSNELDLLFVKKLDLDLKYKLIVEAGGFRATNKKHYNIASMDLNAPVDKALAEIRQRLKCLSIESMVPGTYRGSCFILTYKLVATFYMTSKEYQNHTSKVRVSIPVLVRYKGDLGGDTLPPYDPGEKEYVPIEKDATQ